jgi:hypothetical protein
MMKDHSQTTTMIIAQELGTTSKDKIESACYLLHGKGRLSHIQRHMIAISCSLKGHALFSSSEPDVLI